MTCLLLTSSTTTTILYTKVNCLSGPSVVLQDMTQRFPPIYLPYLKHLILIIWTVMHLSLVSPTHKGYKCIEFTVKINSSPLWYEDCYVSLVVVVVVRLHMQSTVFTSAASSKKSLAPAYVRTARHGITRLKPMLQLIIRITRSIDFVTKAVIGYQLTSPA